MSRQRQKHLREACSTASGPALLRSMDIDMPQAGLVRCLRAMLPLRSLQPTSKRVSQPVISSGRLVLDILSHRSGLAGKPFASIILLEGMEPGRK
jgi:hypothetical protein